MCRRKGTPHWWLCSPQSRYRKGAESERTAVENPRFASFSADGDSKKSGGKCGQKVIPKLPFAGEKGGGCESTTKSVEFWYLKADFCMETCESRLFCIL